MADQRSSHSSRRARPVAELALEPLIERAPQISRRWAIGLIVDAPLETLGAIPLEDLARDAPGLVSGLLDALHSDVALGMLLEGGRSAETPARGIARMSGAPDSASVVAAVEALRGAVWEALLDEFGTAAPDPPRARALTDLSDRLAHVCAAILPIALAGGPAAADPPTSIPAATAAPVAGSSAAGPARTGVVIVDERAQPGPPATVQAAAEASVESVAEPSRSGEIQIRDERSDEGPAAWIRSIGRQLEAFDQTGASFAVLLVELRGEAPADQGAIAWEPLEELLADELGAAGGGTVTRERAGRYWLLAPATDRIGAGSLAARLTGALGLTARKRGLRLSVAVGTAICPEDGRRASALAAHADVGLFAARSERHLAAPAEGRPDA